MKSDNQNLTWQQQVEYRKVHSFGLDFNRVQRLKKGLAHPWMLSVDSKTFAEELVRVC